MKPLWRWMPTEALGSRSIVTICGCLLPIVALTYWPSSLPACSLFVAYVAATALAGVVAVSRAMTTTPASWAFLIASSTPPELLGVMRMPLTPCWTRFSIAVTWPALSPSNLPASAIRLLPSFSACALADSRSLTK